MLCFTKCRNVQSFKWFFWIISKIYLIFQKCVKVLTSHVKSFAYRISLNISRTTGNMKDLEISIPNFRSPFKYLKLNFRFIGTLISFAVKKLNNMYSIYSMHVCLTSCFPIKDVLRVSYFREIYGYVVSKFLLAWHSYVERLNQCISLK